MTSPRALLLATFAILSAIALRSPLAEARGDLGPDHDACILKIGPDLMHFAGYQPGVTKRKFCEDAPQLGETIFVFDYVEPELREMKADFRILRDTPGAEEPDNLASATLAYLAPEVYPKGTFSFEHVFSRPGDYIGIVTVDGAKGEHWVSRFPFSVAKSHADNRPYYLIAVAAALGLLLLLTNRANRRRRGDLPAPRD